MLVPYILLNIYITSVIDENEFSEDLYIGMAGMDTSKKQIVTAVPCVPWSRLKGLVMHLKGWDTWSGP